MLFALTHGIPRDRPPRKLNSQQDNNELLLRASGVRGRRRALTRARAGIFVIYGLYVMQDRLRPGQNPNGDDRRARELGFQNIGFGAPGSIIDIITISLIVGFFNGLSNFVVFIGGGEEALTGKSKLRAAILSAALSA